MIRISRYSFEQTKKFPPLLSDYINGNEKITPFSSFLPELISFKRIIDLRKQSNTDRQVLVDALKSQYSKFAPELLASATPAINSLGEKSTFTVTTGHQLSLFSGPLYFWYKILTTISLSRQLKTAYPEYSFVPVYWMASEDHDFAEISTVYINGNNYKWSSENQGRACGKIPMEGIEEFFNIISPVVSDPSLAASFMRCYSESADLAQATRRLVHTVFGNEELLVLDGDDPLLKQQFAGVMKDDLIASSASGIVTATTERFAAHYKPQVNARDINLFYLDTDVRGRIVKEGADYKVLDTQLTFSEEQLLTELNAHPERFSPNVILRPLFQEKILPNLAYVGGPGELTYWLQLKELFEHYKIIYPVLMPRQAYGILDGNLEKKLAKSDLPLDIVFEGKEGMLKKLSLSAVDYDTTPLKQAIDNVYEQMTAFAKSVDPTLEASAAAEHQKAVKGLETVYGKVIKAVKRKEELNNSWVTKIDEQLFPENGLQERVVNILNFQNGAALISEILENCEPFDFNFKLLIKD